MGSEKRLTREYSVVASAITRLSVVVDDPTRGIQLFNSGHFWEAHEAWELAWTPDRKGSESGFYKDLIQVAAGCLHYQRRNRRGSVNKWTSGADYLRPYLPVHHGVRLAELVGAVDAFLAAIQDGAWPDLEMPQIAQE